MIGIAAGDHVMIEIDPTVDFACKMLLGDPTHSGLTVHFLNAVLRPNSPIVQVEHLNPMVPTQFDSDKLAILDILARDERGARYNIEVQRTRHGGLRERLTWYAATQLGEQIGKGDGYDLLEPSIGICILKGRLFPTSAEYHHQFRLRTQKGLELTDCLEIHTLELFKYQPPPDTMTVEEPLEQWMDFFCNARGSTAENLKRRLPSPIFEEAIGILEMIDQTPEQRRQYLARLKWELDQNTNLRFSRAEGWKQGKAEGMAEGIAEGKAEGKAEAKAENIQLLQRILGIPPLDLPSLLAMSLEELTILNAELATRLEHQKPRA